MVTLLGCGREKKEELVEPQAAGKDHGDNCECSSKLLHGFMNPAFLLNDDAFFEIAHVQFRASIR